MARKKKRVFRDKEFKMKALAALEVNEMNYSQTAREFGITRTTLARYKDSLWEEHQSRSKALKRRNMLERLVVSDELDAIRNRVVSSFVKSMDEMDERIAHPEEHGKVSNAQLVAHINNLLPYIVEKLGMLGIEKPKENNPLNNYTTFVQTFVNQMNTPDKDIIDIEINEEETE